MVKLRLAAQIVLISLSILGYIFNWGWTGLGPYSPPLKGNNFQRGKTLWDWLQLLIIPAVLAVGGYLFNYTSSKNERDAAAQRDQTERDIAADNQREAALQAYIDKMSELLLAQNLRNASKDGDRQNTVGVRTLLDPRGVPIHSRPSGPTEAQKIARVRTLTVLRGLDAERKGSVLRFLCESGLIYMGKSVIDLAGADLLGANLNSADLGEAYLRNAYLSGAELVSAKLSFANLRGADLEGADLRFADLDKADLRDAILYDADLSGAKVTKEQLEKAKSLEGATMPDGSKHS